MDKDNIKTLILLYQQHPCLYVTKSVDYHNRNKRDKALQIICEQYKNLTGQLLTPEIIKKKINNLRTQYLDHLNKIKQSKASGASADDMYKPSWWLFEEMSFLDPYIAQRKGESSLIISKAQPKDTEFVYEICDNEDSDDLQFSDIQDIIKTEDNKENIKKNIYQNVQSPASSCSSSSKSHSGTPLSKRRRVDSSDNTSNIKNEFWNNAANVMKLMEHSEQVTEDGLKHWIFYLENELRNIKNLKTLKTLQRKIIQLIDNTDTESRKIQRI